MSECNTNAVSVDDGAHDDAVDDAVDDAADGDAVIGQQPVNGEFVHLLARHTVI